MSRQLGELDRQLAGLVRIGTIDSVDASTYRARVRVSPDVLSAPLRWLADAFDDAVWNPPSEGAQVLVICPSGDLAQGVIVRGLYSASNPPPSDGLAVRRVTFRDGTVVEYDTDAGVLRVDAAGDVIVEAAGNAVVAGTRVNLGSESASDPVVRKSDFDATWNYIKSWLVLHVHPTTTPGSPTGVSANPVLHTPTASSVVHSE